MENEVNKTTQAIPYGEEKEENIGIDTKELMPIWMERLPNGNLSVKTNEGIFEIEDIPYDEVMKAKKRITRDNAIDMDKFEVSLISSSLVKPKLGELDLIKLKGSTVMKLRAAIYKMYDIASFLSI